MGKVESVDEAEGSVGLPNRDGKVSGTNIRKSRFYKKSLIKN